MPFLSHTPTVGAKPYGFLRCPIVLAAFAMSASDSPALLDSALAKNRVTELDALHRVHGHWLLAFLRRRFSAQEAEDLAQETYLRAVGAQVEIRNPRAFLAQIARRTAIDKARQSLSGEQAVAEHTRRERLSTAVDDTDALALKQAILALPPKLREVLVLSRFVGLTYAEIANRCGVSVDTVQDRMEKAQTMCSALMRD
jgi:RNA polymerase sigma factor (sigma-70 family)